MSFDGPKTIDPADRNFGLGAPVFRIWTGATLDRECQFDNAKNEPHLQPYGWPIEYEAGDAFGLRGNTGTRYPQPQGCAIIATVSFKIYHPDHAPPSVAVPPFEGFTEADWKELTDAAMYPATYDIEFYPHYPASGSKQTKHIVTVEMPPPVRGENMTVNNCTISVRGRYVQTATPTEM